MSKGSRAILVVDLAFGDCGKGAVVDFLTRCCEANLIVRFNGGPQAGHNVVTDDGRHHTFSQFGSGMFVPGVRTLLSRFMLIEPYAMLNEASHLESLGVEDPLGRLLIDARCPVITPAHQAANRLREIARGNQAHGTCGLGIGELMQDLQEQPELMIRAAELGDRAGISRKLREIAAAKLKLVERDESQDPRAAQNLKTLTDLSWIDAAVENYALVASRARIVAEADVRSVLSSPGTKIFEGAQGVLLDERFGFDPHTTWSTTTFANADVLLNEAGIQTPRTRVGVLRTYFTRHGPGPFVTEDNALRTLLPEPHNDDEGWQGPFRVGVFDAVAARYALASAGPVDMLGVTHVDRIPRLPKRICDAYVDERNGRVIQDISEYKPEERNGRLRRCTPLYADVGAEGLLATIARGLRSPVGLWSDGPTAKCFHLEDFGEALIARG
ncbi:MAG TPA: adenylosuccinate synthetase [Tepidisphaeraceae bacterium]